VSAEPLDPRTFRNVLGQFCTGITVITTMHDGAPVGFACQSFAALSLDPPLVLFCPTKVSRSWQAIEASGKFCVNVLHEKQKDVSARFGSKEPDKFAEIDWLPSKLGSPIIEGTLAHIDCTVHSVHDGGDHYVVFGAVHSLSDVPHKKPRPLLFYRGDYTGIEPDKTTPAHWRDDLEAFLTATTDDTWL
jgi:3-hydroxy-9,10-secoandrosta-1,3,5(10)-triene-9,17-dione monooxygenase reductase component